MADFQTAFNIGAANESGYVNDPNDLGGETYRGIARKYNPQWAGWTVIDAYKSLVGTPSKGFTNPQWDTLASSFYKASYWDKIMGDQIADQDEANIIYDGSLSGLGRTISLVKTVLNKKFNQDLGQGTTMDGDTITSLNQVPASDFFNEFKKARQDFFIYSAAQLQPNDSIYYALFKQFNPNPTPSNSEYLKGWLNRVAKFSYGGITAVGGAIKANPLITVGIVLVAITGLFFIFKSKTS